MSDGAISEVRLAQRDDEDALLEHSRMLWRENGLFSYSEAKARDLMRRAFDRQGGIIGVLGPSGAPEASIYLSLIQPYYSDDWQLTELWNYVMPPRHHRGGHAKKLIEFAKGCSDQMKIPFVIGILSDQRVEAKARLYGRQLEPGGVFFVHNRQHARGPLQDQRN